jgi:hypothetical protein
MKNTLKLMVTAFLVVVFYSGISSAASIESAGLISDVRDGQWILQASVYLNDDDYTNNPVINLLGSSNTLIYFSDTDEYYLGLSTEPASVNGNNVSFSLGSSTVGGDVSSDPYSGVFAISESSYLGVVGGTAVNPIISWSNTFNADTPDHVYITEYAIRIFDKADSYGSWLVDYRVSADAGDEIFEFDFSTVPFEFDSDIDYGIRLEARIYTSFLNIQDTSSILDDQLWLMNRSVVIEDYVAPVPVPATIFLLGFGLLSLVGITRKKQL